MRVFIFPPLSSDPLRYHPPVSPSVPAPVPTAGPPYYTGQTVYPPSPPIIVPTPQQPPPAKREKKTVSILVVPISTHFKQRCNNRGCRHTSLIDFRYFYLLGISDTFYNLESSDEFSTVVMLTLIEHLLPAVGCGRDAGLCATRAL